MLLELDGAKVEKALKISDEFKKLYQNHHLLEKKIAKMSKAKIISEELAVEKKRLQKIKLAEKDRMTEIVKTLERSQ